MKKTVNGRMQFPKYHKNNDENQYIWCGHVFSSIYAAYKHKFIFIFKPVSVVPLVDDQEFYDPKAVCSSKSRIRDFYCCVMRIHRNNIEKISTLTQTFSF